MPCGVTDRFRARRRAAGIAGHRISNLVPCCKPCNSAKGSKHWESFLATISKNEDELFRKKDRIRAHLAMMSNDRVPRDDEKYRELRRIRDEVLCLLSAEFTL